MAAAVVTMATTRSTSAVEGRRRNTRRPVSAANVLAHAGSSTVAGLQGRASASSFGSATIWLAIEYAAVSYCSTPRLLIALRPAAVVSKPLSSGVTTSGFSADTTMLAPKRSRIAARYWVAVRRWAAIGVGSPTPAGRTGGGGLSEPPTLP